MSTVGFSLNKALKAQWEFGDFHALPRLYLTQGGVCRTLQTQLQVLARILHITSSRLCRRSSFGSCPAHAWDSAGKGAVRARSPPVLSMRRASGVQVHCCFLQLSLHSWWCWGGSWLLCPHLYFVESGGYSVIQSCCEYCCWILV